MKNRKMYLFWKRIFDIFLSVVLLLLLFPLMGLVALLVWCAMGRPIFFKQTRPGYLGKPFELYKFRTMADRRDRDGRQLPDAQRLTVVGNLLRKTSLDELPELFNVFKGDMSFVGPRPLLMEYLERYTPQQARRHEVKPGITGWAQVNGRNAISWQDKFKFDVWYVDHCNIWVDIKIILLTFYKMIIREGINQPGQATAEEFMGENKLVTG